MDGEERLFTIRRANGTMELRSREYTVEQNESFKQEAEKARRENSELKSSLRDLYSVVKYSLLTLDWTLKLGSVAAVWLFTLPQDRMVQAIAVASFSVLVTLVSKGISSMKAIEEKVGRF